MAASDHGGVAGGVERLGLDVFVALGEGAFGMFFAEDREEGFNFGHEGFGGADFFTSGGLGDFAGVEALELAALEEAAAGGAVVVDAAGAFLVRGAGLKEDALAFLFPNTEAEGGEFADGIVTEDADGVEEDTVAAEAALGAEGFGGG